MFSIFKWKSSNQPNPLGRIEISWINGPVILTMTFMQVWFYPTLPPSVCSSVLAISGRPFMRMRVVPVRFCVQKMDRCPSRLSVPSSCDFVITCVMLQRLSCNVPFRRAVGVKVVRPGNKCKWLEIVSDAGYSYHFCWLISCSILPDRWLLNKMVGPSLIRNNL